MSDPDKRVACEIHSETPATFVCRHLRLGTGCGFHVSVDDPDDPWPDAWCDRCEAALQREGGWSESNEPDISLLCTGCYETARARNRYVPAPLAPGQLSVSAAEFGELARQTCERCKVRQDAALREWPLVAEARRWQYDGGTRLMRFFDQVLGETVIADVTTTGSFSTRTNTWMWSWADEHGLDSARAEIGQVRVFGEVRGIAKLQDAHWPAEEVDAWEVTQIAADLLGAEVIYRAPMDHLLVFMLLNNLRMVYPT